LSGGIRGGPGNAQLLSESFVRAQQREQNKISRQDYQSLINNKMLEKTIRNWEKNAAAAALKQEQQIFRQNQLS
jgi:hypothetical protein